MTRPFLAAAAAAVAAALLTGCTPHPTAPHRTTAPHSSSTRGAAPAAPSTGPSAPGAPVPAPTAAVGDKDVVLTPAQVAAAQASAVSIAGDGARLFCRPGLDAATWIHQLTPLLTVQAIPLFTGTNPETITCSTITGTATVVDGDSVNTLEVTVPSDQGAVTVTVSRPTAGDSWRIGMISQGGTQ